MFKYFFTIALTVMLCGCALFGTKLKGSVDPDVRNYADLEKRSPQKQVVFECDFSRISVGDPAGEKYCTEADNPDYVSYFISFSYQGLPNTFTDHMLNLSKELDKDGLLVEKAYINDLTTTSIGDVNILVYNKLEPSSFAVNSDDKSAIFISKKDILLRNRVYPSLKVISLEAPSDKLKTDVLSEYRLKYTVYPHTLSSYYSTSWLSYFLGMPLFGDVEKLFEMGSKSRILSFFKNIENSNGLSGGINLNSKNMTGEELARPFIFADKAKTIYGNDKNPIAPSFPREREGYLNEYLPRYDLERIEIIRKSSGGRENVMQTYSEEEITALLTNRDENIGFYFVDDKLPSGAYSVRFIHKAQKPRYTDEGTLRGETSGISYIYSSIGRTIATDIDVSKYYDFQSIPIKCIIDADIEGLLDRSGYTEYEKDSLLSKFIDAVSECSDNEFNMTKIIFNKNSDSKDFIK